MVGKMREVIGKLKEIKLGNMAHWIMVEARDQVTAGVLDWLRVPLCKL
jgi:hypothetical protein